MRYEITLFHWLEDTGEFPLSIPVTLGIDPLSALLLGVATFIGLLSVIREKSIGPGRDLSRVGYRAAALMLWLSTTLLFVSTNFVVLLFFWELSVVAACVLMTRSTEAGVSASGARRLFLHTRIGDAALLGGILLIWARFGSLDFAVVVGGRDGAVPVEHDATGSVTAIGVCLFVGAAARCAQVPFFGWLDRSAHVPPLSGALLHAAFLPAGAYLIARCLPLFEASVHARGAVAFAGGVTAVLTAAAAAVASGWRAALSRSSAAFFGLIFVGLASGHSAGVIGAVLLLVTHSLVKGALLLADDRPGWAGLAGIAILGSGLWGQNAILAALWSDGSHDAAANAPLPGGWSMLLLVLAATSIFLTAFALVRAFLANRDRAGDTPATARPGWPAMLGVGAALLVGCLSVVPGQPFDRFVAQTWPRLPVSAGADAFATGLSVLLALLGGVSAWMLAARRSPRAERRTGRLRPALRLLARGRYVDRLVEDVLLSTVQRSARLCRLFDRRVLSASVSGLPAGISRLAGWTARPLQSGQVQFYAVAIALAAAVLLAALTWFGR